MGDSRWIDYFVVVDDDDQNRAAQLHSEYIATSTSRLRNHCATPDCATTLCPPYLLSLAWYCTGWSCLVSLTYCAEEADTSAKFCISHRGINSLKSRPFIQRTTILDHLKQLLNHG